MANEVGSLPSPESEVDFAPVDPEISLQNQARLQERERRKNANPPTNSDNKYVCVHSNPFEKPQRCADLVFDRKCEWNKHMDKHDRPFRCEHPDCSKLQGFTYPGGLARHEKEVHGKHGGPTSQLVCPFSNCKRSRGKKFTRKENLEEHIKRCHTLEGIGEDAETPNNALEQSHSQTVDSLLASASSQPEPIHEAPEAATTTPLRPTANASFEPNNIDPAIAAAQDANGLSNVTVDTPPSGARKRKAAANFVFKLGDGPTPPRGRRRKLNSTNENQHAGAETNSVNLFEELERLRAENARLQIELEARDARIAALENVMNGFDQQTTA